MKNILTSIGGFIVNSIVFVSLLVASLVYVTDPIAKTVFIIVDSLTFAIMLVVFAYQIFSGN